MVHAVLDPGVLVAAVITPRGTCGRLLRGALDGRFELIVSPKLLAELRGVLDRPKFRRYVTPAEVGPVIRRIAQVARLAMDPEPGPHGLSPDPKDDYLIALAQAEGADYLISGDAHLLRAEDPPRLLPGAFLGLLDELR